METGGTVGKEPQANPQWNIKWVTGHFERGEVTVTKHRGIELVFKSSQTHVFTPLQGRPVQVVTFNVTYAQLGDLIDVLTKAKALYEAADG